MVALKVVAPAPVENNDLISNAYVTNLLAAGLTQNAVDSLITSGLSSYATKAYVVQQDALLATQTYVNAGDATRLHLSQVGVNNGVAGLGSTARVDPARVQVASTQRWAQAFWSPVAYNGGDVAATTETQLYPCAVSDPGFAYKLLVFGSVTGKVSLDNGEYPIVYVRVGSISGQIIAYGAGTAECYQVASSRATIGNSFPCGKDSWVTATGWTAQNTGGYSTTLSNNHIVVPYTMTATLSASVTYSGATSGFLKPSASTGVRIVTDSGTVIATGAEHSGNSGTATVSWTGSITGNQGLRIEVGQTGADDAATVTSGFFQIIGPQTDNTGPITLAPYNMGAQSVKTGATTLYVTLRRSGGSSTVTALPSYPDLFVVALPA